MSNSLRTSNNMYTHARNKLLQSNNNTGRQQMHFPPNYKHHTNISWSATVKSIVVIGIEGHLEVESTLLTLLLSFTYFNDERRYYPQVYCGCPQYIVSLSLDDESEESQLLFVPIPSRETDICRRRRGRHQTAKTSKNSDRPIHSGRISTISFIVIANSYT